MYFLNPCFILVHICLVGHDISYVMSLQTVHIHSFPTDIFDIARSFGGLHVYTLQRHCATSRTNSRGELGTNLYDVCVENFQTSRNLCCDQFIDSV